MTIRAPFNRLAARWKGPAVRSALVRPLSVQTTGHPGDDRAMSPTIRPAGRSVHAFSIDPRTAEPSPRQRSQTTMYPMNPSMSSIAVSRHDDYLAEANRDHMARIARQGKPRTTVLADVRRTVGGVVIAIGERVAGRPVATGPAMPGISSLR